MCTHPFAKKALTLHLARSEGHERYFGCNLMHRKVLASFHQHLMAEAPHGELGLRHPLGTYNTSVAVVAKRVTRVISLLRAVVPETGSGHTESSEQVDALLESQEALLQGLMQHMDDCINILRGFTVDRRDFDKSRHVKVYRRAVDQYRSHIGKVAGRIKHSAGSSHPADCPTWRKLFRRVFRRLDVFAG